MCCCRSAVLPSTTQEKYPGAKNFRNFTKLPKTDPIFPIFRRNFLVGCPYEQDKESKIAKIIHIQVGVLLKRKLKRSAKRERQVP